MHPLKLATLSKSTVLVLALSAPVAWAGNEACKVLTAEKFSEIMGYAAKTTASSEAMCLYKGAGDAGGMLMIVTEEATPQVLAMANGPGSIPHGNAGKLGASFSKGTIVFSIGIAGTDASKITALAAEVKRNLK
jgi:hypothetical protein